MSRVNLIAKHRALILTTVALLSPSFCSGAEIDYIRNDSTVVIGLAGPIEPGDFSRLKELVISSLPEDPDAEPRTVSLFIFSAGGDIVEAQAIGTFVREYLIGVHAATTGQCKSIQRGSKNVLWGWWPENVQREVGCVCYSACFIVWASGVPRTGGNNWLGFANAMEYVPRVETFFGVHRPRFPAPYFASSPAEQAEEKYISMSKGLRAYLSTVELPSHIIEKMFSTSSSDMYVLSGGDLEAIGSLPIGIYEWIESKCSGILIAEEARDRESLRLASVQQGLSRPEANYLEKLNLKHAEYSLCKMKALETAQVERLSQLR